MFVVKFKKNDHAIIHKAVFNWNSHKVIRDQIIAKNLSEDERDTLIEDAIGAIDILTENLDHEFENNP